MPGWIDPASPRLTYEFSVRISFSTDAADSFERTIATAVACDSALIVASVAWPLAEPLVAEMEALARLVECQLREDDLPAARSHIDGFIDSLAMSSEKIAIVSAVIDGVARRADPEAFE